MKNYFSRPLLLFFILLNTVLVHAQNNETTNDCYENLKASLEYSAVQTNQNYVSLNSPTAWTDYANNTKDDISPQRTLLLMLSAYGKKHLNPGLAIDLGAGTGKDTLYLLKNGWHVLAIDFSVHAIEVLTARAEAKTFKNLQTQVADFTEMELPETVDVVNASYALSFIPPNQFLSVWQTIDNHLAIGGYFAGNFFGTDDDYAKENGITILNQKQITCLFKNYKILYIKERKITADNLYGQIKHWDIWDVVAEKLADEQAN